MRVVIPWATEYPEVRAAVEADGWTPEMVYVGDDPTHYHGLLGDLWDDGESFCIVEHDIVVFPGALAEMDRCPDPWCARPYELSVGMGAWLGCTRFSADLLRDHPAAVRSIDHLKPDGTPLRHWARLDTRLEQVLTREGAVKRTHWPAVVHLNPSQKFAGAYNCVGCGAAVPPGQVRLGPPPFACRSCGWRPRCAEYQFGPRGERVPCPHRARVIARTSPAVAWTPLCGTHENTDRWANYPDIEWRDVTA